jgi:hypothetical protein
VGNDDTPVATHRLFSQGSGAPAAERLMTGAEARVSRRPDAAGKPAALCETQGAMSLQSREAAHDRDGVPQKLLQLVGYRDPNAGLNVAADPWRRPQWNGGARNRQST